MLVIQNTLLSIDAEIQEVKSDFNNVEYATYKDTKLESKIAKHNSILCLGVKALEFLELKSSLSYARKELIKDKFLVSYDPVIIDECAEEEMETDFLFDIQKAIYLDLGFRPKTSLTEYKIAYTVEDVKKLAEYTKETGICSFDYETPKINDKGLNYFGDDFLPTSLSISFQVGSGWVVPLWHDCQRYTEEQKEEFKAFSELKKWKEKDYKKFLDLIFIKYEVDEFFTSLYNTIKLHNHIESLVDIDWKAVLDNIDNVLYTDEQRLEFIESLKPVFADKEVDKIAHNFKFDAHNNRNIGLANKGRWDDTMLMSFVYKNTNRHRLKELAKFYYPHFVDYDKAIEMYDWSHIPISLQAKYNACDTDVTLRLKIVFESFMIEEDERMYVTYRNNFMSTQKALFDMETEGMLVDREQLEKNIIEANEILEVIEKECRAYPEVVKFEEAKEGEKKKEELEAANEKLAKQVEKLEERVDKKVLSLQEKINKVNPDEILQKELKVLEDKIYSINTSKMEGKVLEKALKKLQGFSDLFDKYESGEEIPKKVLTAKARCEAYEQQIKELQGGKLSKEFDKAQENIELVKTLIRDLKIGKVKPKYEGINFKSTKQLGELFYDEIGFNFNMPYDWKKKEKVRGTAKDLLSQIDDETGFIESYSKLKAVSHTINNFLVGILDRLDKNNKVHSSFKQTIKTGRLSSTNPNLQNIPPTGRSKYEEANRVTEMVKSVFISLKGYKYWEFDLSQAEMRVAAYLGKVKAMLQGYADGIDLHAKTASSVLGITLDEFYKLDKKEQKKHRNRAKPVNFGYLYGQSAKGFVEYAKNSYGAIFTEEEAEHIREVFFNTYPELLDYHSIYIAKAKKFGGVRTIFGYKCHIDDINSDNSIKRNQAENLAVNAAVQGTSGQYTNFVISLLKHRLPESVKMVNTVHDSIHFYIPTAIEEEIKELILDTFENPPLETFFGKRLDGIEMVTDASVGESWGTIIEL